MFALVVDGIETGLDLNDSSLLERSSCACGLFDGNAFIHLLKYTITMQSGQTRAVTHYPRMMPSLGAGTVDFVYALPEDGPFFPCPADANGKATSITRYIWQVDCFKVKDQQAKATGALMIASDVTSKLTATDRFWKCVSPTKYSSAPCYARCCYVKP